ncbi:mitochondrial calcium uniporter regulator 1 [Malurus melanocephalus]|uniref:mitochondrial calcium uniporter regulator 1 n=1 Tax=Malurus melanocephalus TaxID=175006 RepID=UPI0025492392|nr:mitochondrial calcium uniporter regulator 1 [Malurus melanocephalus]
MARAQAAAAASGGGRALPAGMAGPGSSGKGLECTSPAEQLRELGVFSLAEGKLRGNFVALYSYSRGGCSKVQVGLFSRATSDRIRRHSLKVRQGRQVMKVYCFNNEGTECVDFRPHSFEVLTGPPCCSDSSKGRDVSISVSSSVQSKENISLLGNRRLYFDTHALVCLLEENGFTTQQSEVIVSALVKIMNTNLDMIYKDMVTKVQQEIALQQVMSHIGGVKKDMIILEKSEFSALRSENEKIKLELQQIKKQVMDEITKVRADNKLNLNLEKSRVKELYSLNERKLLEMRTEIVELHAQQDRALTQTDRKIDTEVADLKTMLESHKLDNIKYLAGSVFTCLTVALGFYRLWI